MRAHVFPVYFFAATFVHVRYTRTPTSPSSRGIRPSSCRRFKRFLMRPFRAGANKRFTTVDLTIRYRVCHISLQSPLPIFPVLCDCPPIHTSFARRTMRGPRLPDRPNRPYRPVLDPLNCPSFADHLFRDHPPLQPLLCVPARM